MGFWSKLFGKNQDDAQPEVEGQEAEVMTTEDAPAEEVVAEESAEEVAEEVSDDATEESAEEVA